MNVVVFTKHNARVLKGKRLDKDYSKENVLLDPDLSLVHGVPPQYWKREGDRIIEMSPEEKRIRDTRIKFFGTQCDIEDYIYPGRKDKKLARYKAYVILSLIIALIAVIFGVYALHSRTSVV